MCPSRARPSVTMFRNSRLHVSTFSFCNKINLGKLSHSQFRKFCLMKLNLKYSSRELSKLVPIWLPYISSQECPRHSCLLSFCTFTSILFTIKKRKTRVNNSVLDSLIIIIFVYLYHTKNNHFILGRND